MDTQVQVSIELYSRALRYVVLERRAGRSILRRLGSFDFEFDLDEEMRRTPVHGHLDLIRDAVEEAVGKTTPTSLSVTLHPPTSFAFKTPLPASMTPKARTRHLKQEASLLLGMMPSDDVHVEAAALRNSGGTSVDWMQVTALPASLHWRVSQMVEPVPVSDFAVHASTHAVARLFRADPAQAVGGEHPYLFLIGWYPDHAELVVVHEEGWHHDIYVQQVSPEDCAYFAALLLKRLEIDARKVGRLFLYGFDVEAEAFERLSAVFDRAPEVLDPAALLHLDASEAVGAFETSQYAPCLGAVV